MQHLLKQYRSHSCYQWESFIVIYIVYCCAYLFTRSLALYFCTLPSTLKLLKFHLAYLVSILHFQWRHQNMGVLQLKEQNHRRYKYLAMISPFLLACQLKNQILAPHFDRSMRVSLEKFASSPALDIKDGSISASFLICTFSLQFIKQAFSSKLFSIDMKLLVIGL